MKNELFRMFKYRSMIKSMAFCAASFALLSVLLKTGIVFIPEVSEVRICNILTFCYGIWFGPAGAWGCALGNLIGDLGGSLTVLTIPGFVANFVSAWIPYKIWEVMGSAMGENPMESPGLHSKKWVIRYLLGGFCAVVTCSAILSFSFDLTEDMSAVNTFIMIFMNNFSAMLLGILLYIVMSNIPKKVLKYWRVQMDEERSFDFSPKHRKIVYAQIILTVTISAFVVIYMLSKGLSFSIRDELHKAVPMVVFIIYSAVQIVINFLCRWEEKDTQITDEINLD